MPMTQVTRLEGHWIDADALDERREAPADSRIFASGHLRFRASSKGPRPVGRSSAAHGCGWSLTPSTILMDLVADDTTKRHHLVLRVRPPRISVAAGADRASDNGRRAGQHVDKRRPGLRRNVDLEALTLTAAGRRPNANGRRRRVQVGVVRQEQVSALTGVADEYRSEIIGAIDLALPADLVDQAVDRLAHGNGHCPSRPRGSSSHRKRGSSILAEADLRVRRADEASVRPDSSELRVQWR